MIQVPRVPPQNSPYPDRDSVKLFAKNWWLFFSSITGYLEILNDFVQSGTHAERLALPIPSLPLGSLFIESDRNNLIYQLQPTAGTPAPAPHWQYVSGTYKLAQADVAALVADLSTSDEGLLLNVTDFEHVLQWDSLGPIFKWGPGELGSGMMQLFEVDPTGVGWHLYDGTANVPYLKSDGTTGTVTLPDLAGTAAYTKAGSPNSGPNAAVAPTLSIGSIDAAVTGVTATTTGPSATVNVLQSSVTTVATGAHNHSVSVNDPTHTHTMAASTAGSNGEPRNIVRRPWFRI